MDREDIELDIRVLKDDLIAACNSLGQLDANDGVYMKDRDCKTCLKEVIRALNNDDKQLSIRCLLGDMNIINSDLIPIINQYCDFNDGDIDLFNLVLRLCTNLTSSHICTRAILTTKNITFHQPNNADHARCRLRRGIITAPNAP